jgi:uncharacterized protein (TIGR02001 family)
LDRHDDALPASRNDRSRSGSVGPGCRQGRRTRSGHLRHEAGPLERIRVPGHLADLREAGIAVEPRLHDRSGFYLGTFLSNIKWLKDTADVNGFSTGARVEWDIYGGYRYEFVKDWTLDVGYLRYEYPSSGGFNPSPNTDEVYIGVATGPWSAKYSYSINDTFGVPNSKGSDYFEIDWNPPITFVSDKLTFNGVLGHQTYAHNGDLSYTVWKAGATWDFGSGWNAGGYVKGTDAHHDLYTVKGKDWSETRLVGFVTCTF